MKTATKAPAFSYSPRPYHKVYDVLIRQTNGLQIMNLLWLSVEFDKDGYTDLSNPALAKAVAQTCNHSIATCEPRNPHVYDPAGNVSALLLQPPDLFAAWLNKLPADLIAKLPMHQHLGAEWLATVNRRLPLCNQNFDAVPDVSLAQAALAKFSR